MPARGRDACAGRAEGIPMPIGGYYSVFVLSRLSLSKILLHFGQDQLLWLRPNGTRSKVVLQTGHFGFTRNVLMNRVN